MSTQPMAAPVLSTPDTHILEDPTIPVILARSLRLSDAEIHKVYEIERTAREIIQGGWERAALQFPDGMLVDAPRVFEALNVEIENFRKKSNNEAGENSEGSENGKVEQTRMRLYILADTSYGSCCVDEIAAEHVDAQVVVHYGRACLSPTVRLPVVYVFTTRPLEIENVVQAFEESFGQEEEGADAKVVVMADLIYQEHVKILTNTLHKKGWRNIRATEVIHNPTASIPNRKILWEGEDVDEEGLKDWRIWHISDPPSALLLTLSSRIKELLIYPTSNDTKTASTQVIRSNTTAKLRRRYALLTRLTTTPIIGILINTLSVANYLSSITSLQGLISAAGKKSYTFVVGKVNAAKMANFGEIGGWVVIGCWESSLVEGGDFYAPVVTPFELSLALQADGERIWSGEWRGDFDSIPTPSIAAAKKENGFEVGEVKKRERMEISTEDSDDEEESAPPEFDLRTGRYVSHSRPMRSQFSGAMTMVNTSTVSQADPTPASKSLARRAKLDIASVNGAASPGAEYLRTQRTWTGLGSDFLEEGQQEAGVIEEGRGGVARGYRVGGEGERT
ncbi:putative Diphthamide biosynthesis protein 2 [Tricladium varicosporioides]|nr:putative Diphthamide biosynthesis protein 2 [Hymenoscyphus varicosporioides]